VRPVTTLFGRGGLPPGATDRVGPARPARRTRRALPRRTGRG